jgi:hypothetical protein
VGLWDGLNILTGRKIPVFCENRILAV